MNELVSVGMILLLALLAGHVVKVLRIPEVTGYLLAGVALGPSLLGWISDSNLQALGILSDVALGLILFSIGTVFELQQFRRIGRKLAMITVCEASLTAVMVGGALLAAGQPAESVGGAGGDGHRDSGGINVDGDPRMQCERTGDRVFDGPVCAG